MDGQPVTAVVNLEDNSDLKAIQAVLDSLFDEGKESQPEQVIRLRQTVTRAIARTAIELAPSLWGFSPSIFDIIPWKSAKRRETVEERTTQLVKVLTDTGIDPLMFDDLLTNEMDRASRFPILRILTVAPRKDTLPLHYVGASCTKQANIHLERAKS